jgi:gamma-glutamylcyclotransferase (GGCT)/AIG2-like uncharacterized protein YtfP
MCSIDTDGTTFDGYRDSKLFKVNFTSLVKCGTIEFRQHGGTTDITEINMWLKLLIRFCFVAATLESPSPLELAGTTHPLDTLFSDVLQQPTFMEYYLHRMGVYLSDQPFDFRTRPVFLYGTLMATPLLAWLLTGNRENQDMIVPLRQKASLQHYHRGSVLGKDYPALVKGTENDLVEGLIFFPRNMDDRRKLNNFEGEQYTTEPVKVVLESGEQIEASTYIWSGEKDEVMATDWDFKEFESSRLADWLDLFDGMEFT